MNAFSLFPAILKMHSTFRTLGRVFRPEGFTGFFAVLIVALSIGQSASAQAAHFSGARTYLSGGGSNIYAIAVDARGDLYYTAQNGLGSGSFLFARFADSGAVYTINGFTFPTGLALDSKGDLYVLDSGAGAIQEIVATNGSIPETSSPAFTRVNSGITSQGDMAMDNQGDLFFTSVGSNAVEEIVAINGVIPPSPTVRTLGSGFKVPVGVAVDNFGNVYVGDALNNAVKEIVAVNGSIPASPAILTLGSGFSTPEGLAVDGSGNIFVSDYGNNVVKEILAVNGTIPSAPSIQSLGTYTATQAVALDASGNLYIGDNGNNSGGSIFQVSLASATFAPTSVGASSPAPISMVFTFDQAGTLGAFSVLTQGATGLDFANAGSGSCAANTTYSAGQTCTVNVQFSPRFAGNRYGAAVLYDVSGNVFATGYVQGTGVAPQASFIPPTENVLAGPSVSNPHGIAVDGNGNLYISDDSGIYKESYANGSYVQSLITSTITSGNLLAVDGAGNVYVTDLWNKVLKESPTVKGYAETTVDSGFGYPYAVAVDGSGALYVADANGGRVLKETPSAGAYVRTTIVSGLPSAQAVAVDGSGNLYVGYSGGVVKETLTQGVYTQAGSVFGRAYPNSVAVDAAGNVYLTDWATYNIYKETPTSSGYVESAVVTDLHNILGPWGVALDGKGALFIAYLGGNSLVSANFASAPALNFAGTPVGTTSFDSPLTVTLANDGNAPLAITVPATGSNPSVSSGFSLGSSDPADCPIVSSTSSPVGIAAATSCSLPVSYTPLANGPTVGALTLTDNNLNAPAPGFAIQSVTLNGSAVSPTFTISASPNSVSVMQGNSYDSTITITPQQGFSVSANLSISGLPSGVTASFSQNPTSDSAVLTFTASSTATPGTSTVVITGTAGSVTETATILLQVTASSNYYLTVSTSPASLNIARGSAGSATITTTTWNGYNAPITLSTCSAPIAGVSVAFSPATIAAPGNGTSTMTITVSSNAGTASYPICVQAGGPGVDQSSTFWLYVPASSPAITWPAPAAITYGTALSATQLDATANVPGTFSYSPAAGAVLNAGTQQLTSTFTPTDSTNYTPATANVSLTINKAVPTITWATPSPITYGTALGANQLNATSNVPGTFSYSPGAGVVLSAGTQQLTSTFVPTDTTNYATATATVQLTVNKATPVLSWATPAPINYGTPLSSTQLNATSSVPGTFSYNPAPGIVLPTGTTMLLVTFTPTDTADYNNASASVAQVVNAPGFSITASPASVTVKQGSTASSTIVVSAAGGFSGNVSLSASGLPKGVTATFSPNPASSFSTVTFVANGSASLATSAVTITGKSGAMTQATAVVLTVAHK